MENQKFVGYTVRSNCKINKTKSNNPLAKLTYKKLQNVAKSLGLPAKLKHKILLALVISKKQGRQDIVDLILATNKKKLNHKASPTVSGEGSKAEISLIEEKPEKLRNYTSVQPLISTVVALNQSQSVIEDTTIEENQASSSNTGCDSGFSSFSSIFMENVDFEEDPVITESPIMETKAIEATGEDGEDIEAQAQEKDLVSVLLKYTTIL